MTSCVQDNVDTQWLDALVAASPFLFNVVLLAATPLIDGIIRGRATSEFRTGNHLPADYPNQEHTSADLITMFANWSVDLFLATSLVIGPGTGLFFAVQSSERLLAMTYFLFVLAGFVGFMFLAGRESPIEYMQRRIARIYSVGTAGGIALYLVAAVTAFLVVL